MGIVDWCKKCRVHSAHGILRANKGSRTESQQSRLILKAQALNIKAYKDSAL